MAENNRTTGTARNFDEAIRSPYEAAINSARIIHERNVNYHRALIEMSAEMLREPTVETYRRNVRSLSNQAVKQREAIGALAAESFDACLDLFYAPFFYLREEA